MGKQAPPGLGLEARRIWKDTVDRYELRADELRILADACREVDLVDRMEQQLAEVKGDLLTKGSMGQPVIDPRVAEIRQHRMAFKTLMASLKLPDEESAPVTRSTSARAAAQARWRAGGR